MPWRSIVQSAVEVWSGAFQEVNLLQMWESAGGSAYTCIGDVLRGKLDDAAEGRRAASSTGIGYMVRPGSAA